jgi:hypothetical protein
MSEDSQSNHKKINMIEMRINKKIAHYLSFFYFITL